MLKLIKNEIIKIMHKKSTFIMLGIFIGFIALFSYFNGKDIIYYNYSNEYYFGDSEAEVAIENKVKELYAKYNEDNWQYYVINENLDIIQNYLYSKYEEDPYNIEEYEKEYNNFLKALENDDWKYLVNKDLKEEKENLENLKNESSYIDSKEDQAKLIYQSETRIEMLEYRLNNNIPYGNDYINEAIFNISSLSYAVKEYEYAKDSEKDNYEYELESYIH